MFGGVPPKVGLSPTAPAGAALADRWYPDYNGQFSLGKCLSMAPAPSGRPNYASGDECCMQAYANQASGICLSSLPQLVPTSGTASNVLTPGNTLADAFVNSLHSHARQRSSFITYTCGGTTELPLDSLVVDILFDYEVSVDQTTQASHLLPDLKKQILNDLSHTLGCQASSHRNLRQVSRDEVLLGFHSAEGSDVIDGKKGKHVCSHITQIPCLILFSRSCGTFTYD